ncbi:unnamed protein product [Rhizophagus irregularis]|nr:unnamed protein product [Rhizophagus irregularis]
MVSFDDYLNQNKTESKWNLRDGLLTVDIANTKTAEDLKTVQQSLLALQVKNVLSGLSLSIQLLEGRIKHYDLTRKIREKERKLEFPNVALLKLACERELESDKLNRSPEDLIKIQSKLVVLSLGELARDNWTDNEKLLSVNLKSISVAEVVLSSINLEWIQLNDWN